MVNPETSLAHPSASDFSVRHSDSVDPMCGVAPFCREVRKSDKCSM